jgi:hypothetical protein
LKKSKKIFFQIFVKFEKRCYNTACRKCNMGHIVPKSRGVNGNGKDEKRKTDGRLQREKLRSFRRA